MSNDVLWMPPAGTAALIFDCDGTLADTMPTHYRAWRWMLDQYAIPFPIETFYQYAGIPTDRIIGMLAQSAGVTLADVSGMARQKEERYTELIGEVKPIRAVVEIAIRYRHQMPMAVASGGEGYVVAKTLSVIGVKDWFDVTVCAEDTQRHKPEPDVFLEAARRLGIPPRNCVVFEDSELGLLAAARAEMVGVDVRPWYHVE